jgi:hypothetical protein
LKYLVGQRLAPGLVVAPEAIAEQLALLEKMNADNARMRAVYLDEKNALQAELDAANLRIGELKRLLKIGMSVFCDEHCPSGDHLQACRDADAALSEKPKCQHEWVDARNKYVESGEICLKCMAIRAGNAVVGAKGNCSVCGALVECLYSLRCLACYEKQKCLHGGVFRGERCVACGEEVR